MHKVVIERPRSNPGPSKQRRQANLPDELLPKFEGIKRPHPCRKGLTDLLGPLRRWLLAQAGRPWNDVYSDACAVIKPDNVIRAHVKTHLLQFVERNTFMHNGKVCVIETGYMGRGVIPVENLRFRWNLFYIHPDTGLMLRIPETSKRALKERQPKAEETFRWLAGRVALKKVRGLWYECHFEEVPLGESFKAYDHAQERIIIRSQSVRSGRIFLLCVRKRQLSQRELKKHKLTNAPFTEAQSSAGKGISRLTTALLIFASLKTETSNRGRRLATHNQYLEEQPNFEITSKRRKGFSSETRVKRGVRVVHGAKDLKEKLGRNDLSPCGSIRSFLKLLPALGPF